MRLVTAGGAAAVALALLAPAAQAATSQSAAYSGPAGVAGVMRVGGAVDGSSSGAVSLPTRRRDRSAQVAVSDASGRPVRVEVAQDGQGNGFVTDLGSFCGRSAAPLRLAFPGRPLLVYVVVGDCDGTTSVPTTGTVTARLR